MTSRLRERRRRTERTPGVWLGGQRSPAEDRPEVQHGERGRVYVSWRIFSGLIVASLLTVLFMFFNADTFYIHSIAVGGLQYLTKEEVFALTDIANMHIFWVDPDQVRSNILRSPTVADADVQIGWPPNMVQIVIEERQPALVWEQSGIATWIDLQGRVMRQREDRPDLLRVSSDIADGPVGPNVQINVEVVNGALQLRTLFPNLQVLRYHPEKGLGFQDERGWEAWFGTGTDMPEKMLIYQAIVTNLQGRGIQPGAVDVSNPDAPHYSVLWGR
jgi:cell division septal protein FtsQ